MANLLDGESCTENIERERKQSSLELFDLGIFTPKIPNSKIPLVRHLY